MKTKLLIIAFATIAALSLTAANAPGSSANGLDTCKVTENNTEFFVSSTEKFIKLKKGTLLSWTNAEMHQGSSWSVPRSARNGFAARSKLIRRTVCSLLKDRGVGKVSHELHEFH